MKPRILSLVLLPFAALSAFGEKSDPYRVFHDSDGRSIRATIVRTSPDAVWIRRDDGQTFQVDPEKFSESDRTYIAQWERDNQLADPASIEFSVRRFTDGRKRENTRARKQTVERYGYIVTLENRTTIDLQNLSIEYRVFAQRGDVGVTGQNRELETFPGLKKIAELPSRSKSSFKTDPIELTSIRLRSGWVFSSRDHPNSNQTRIRDDLRGIWIRVMQGGQLIAEFSSPQSLMEKESWDRSQPWTESWWQRNSRGDNYWNPVY